MAFPGGMFKVLDPALTKDPRDPTQRRYYDFFAWGVVTGKTAYVTNRKGDIRLKFALRYRRHMVCHINCAEKNPFVYEAARTLRDGDAVAVVGKMVESEYKRKRQQSIEKFGEIGREQICEANLILPARLFLSMLRREDASVESDSIEGLEEFLKEYDESDADPVFGVGEE